MSDDDLAAERTVFMDVFGEVYLETECGRVPIPDDWSGWSKPRYRVSTWDHDDGRWHSEGECRGKWGLRPLIREMQSRAYDTVSVLIERLD